MSDPKSRFRPFIIPIFLPHAGCPHQCAFCNQTSITGVKRDIFSSAKLRLLINEFLKFKGLVEKEEYRCEQKEQKHNYLLAVIFLSEPSDDDEEGFSSGGWTFKRLPRNPHI